MNDVLLAGLALALAGVGPIIFPAAQSGHGTLPVLATRILLPAILGLAILARLARNRAPWLARDLLGGAIAGILATTVLETVRLTGYHLGFMPGNLPRLMGVLLLDRFALGPSPGSDLAGWAYHFWNGAAFGITYVLLVGTRRRWPAALYGFLIGLGFLLSPVVLSLGVGYFGLGFSAGFPATVLLAHLGFGLALGGVAQLLAGAHPSRVLSPKRAPDPASRSRPSALVIRR
jgi:hypothetical protein